MSLRASKQMLTPPSSPRASPLNLSRIRPYFGRPVFFMRLSERNLNAGAEFVTLATMKVKSKRTAVDDAKPRRCRLAACETADKAVCATKTADNDAAQGVCYEGDAWLAAAGVSWPGLRRPGKGRSAGR